MAENAHPIVHPAITAGLEFSKDDFVVIAVAKFEKQLNTKKRQIDKQLKALKKEATKKAKELELALEELAESSFTDSLKAATDALAALGFKVEGEISVDSNEDGELHCNLSIWQKAGEGRSSYYRDKSSFELFKKVPLNAASETLISTLDALREQQQELSEQAVEVRRELAQLSSKERQARAALAESILRQTSEGQALLDTLVTNELLQLTVDE